MKKIDTYGKDRYSVLNPLKWVKYLRPKPSKEQIQPNGIDLRVDNVYTFDEVNGDVVFSTTKRVGYQLKKLKTETDEKTGMTYWTLQRNQAYIVEYVENVAIPENAMGLFFPRSSLWRLFGAQMYTSVWDSGYQGKGRGMIKTTLPFKLERGTPIGQLVLFSAETSKKYNGKYQNEGSSP